MKRITIVACALVLWASGAFAQGVPIKDGVAATLLKVNTAGAALSNRNQREP